MNGTIVFRFTRSWVLPLAAHTFERIGDRADLVANAQET